MKMNRWKLTAKVWVLVSALSLGGVSARAGVLFSSPNTGTLRDDVGGTVGMQFTPVLPASFIEVTHLGFFDDDLDGNAVAHNVGLWTDSGTLLGSVTVQSGTASSLVGQFRYEALSTPIMLTNGVTYRLGSEVTSGSGDSWHNSNINDYVLGMPATINNRAYDVPGFVFPSIAAFPTAVFLGPNLLGNVIPEPSAALLLGVGGLWLWRRKRMQ